MLRCVVGVLWRILSQFPTAVAHRLNPLEAPPDKADVPHTSHDLRTYQQLFRSYGLFLSNSDSIIYQTRTLIVKSSSGSRWKWFERRPSSFLCYKARILVGIVAPAKLTTGKHTPYCFAAIYKVRRLRH